MFADQRRFLFHPVILLLHPGINHLKTFGLDPQLHHQLFHIPAVDDHRIRPLQNGLDDAAQHRVPGQLQHVHAMNGDAVFPVAEYTQKPADQPVQNIPVYGDIDVFLLNDPRHLGNHPECMPDADLLILQKRPADDLEGLSRVKLCGSAVIGGVHRNLVPGMPAQIIIIVLHAAHSRREYTGDKQNIAFFHHEAVILFRIRSILFRSVKSTSSPIRFQIRVTMEIWVATTTGI
ncbi:hypothetical protein D3C75_822620 [compost metagenome]